MSKAGTCYYSVLGICKQASASEIRDAYRRQALKWHPDRWTRNPNVAGEAKKRFQEIQEAYSVLSDKGKRRIYDAGLLGLLADDDDEVSLCQFNFFEVQWLSQFHARNGFDYAKCEVTGRKQFGGSSRIVNGYDGRR
ncbi:uncharacterized protein LOC110414236 isoform X2 [Herrania umbratica]|uniref:Uncharacterized protein LOC110414236 isoform X2 n=1 Tax=Herrania umbratica TaxID=108875 RepID=A0A6J1A2U9_9ROSI|nr:uncharacterized protein LOC110414236 isoform X2 [Herrania umbratica]